MTDKTKFSDMVIDSIKNIEIFDAKRDKLLGEKLKGAEKIRYLMQKKLKTKYTDPETILILMVLPIYMALLFYAPKIQLGSEATTIITMLFTVATSILAIYILVNFFNGFNLRMSKKTEEDLASKLKNIGVTYDPDDLDLYMNLISFYEKEKHKIPKEALAGIILEEMQTKKIKNGERYLDPFMSKKELEEEIQKGVDSLNKVINPNNTRL